MTNFIDGNGSTDLGYGETHEFNVITQYYETGPVYITESHLGLNSGALYDSSTPPTNVTDADVQAEVLKMTNNIPRTDTVYEVFLPASSYSSDGSYTSCGGPHLTYCAYHGNFSHGSYDVKYASMPYPSCGGCQSSGFSTMQNFEHFISHETREAVTEREDPVAQGIVLWTFNPVPAGFFVCCAKEVPGELTSASVPWCCLWFLQANEQNSHMRLFALATFRRKSRMRSAAESVPIR